MRKDHAAVYHKIQLPFKINKPVLAFGSQAKNTLCFGAGNFAYLSRIHPDLSRPQDYALFLKDARYFLKKHPRVIAYDLHPGYQSTQYALNLSAIRYTLSAVQHHHAHIASCMADNGLENQKVIGVAFDGTGLGGDHDLWGGEFLICDYKNYIRKAHLKEIPLLGGERAIMEPWRLAAAWLYLIYGERFLDLKIRFTAGIDKHKWGILKNMYLKNINSPSASSIGRLFDAVASIILDKSIVLEEAELAIELEKIAARGARDAKVYRYGVKKGKGEYILDPSVMIKEIVADLKVKEAKEKIAYRFHLALAQMILKVCLILRKENKINRVLLSGGVFQNSLLLGLSLDLLYKEGFQVFRHKNAACGDSGVSLGQAAVASFRS
ncbi:MAG: hypothetical protein PHG40_01315 [Candidatus Omnitrophica bacterium]|nr:hypothetical protein [Candidatus Omnitrophota bacterium]